LQGNLANSLGVIETEQAFLFSLFSWHSENPGRLHSGKDADLVPKRREPSSTLSWKKIYNESKNIAHLLDKVDQTKTQLFSE
jgi:hypothetical protein